MSDSQPIFEPVEPDDSPSRSTSVRPLAKLLSTPIPIWTIAPDGNLAFLSASCGSWLGVVPQELVGRSTRNDSSDPLDALARSLAPPIADWAGIIVAEVHPATPNPQANPASSRSVTFIRLGGTSSGLEDGQPTTILAVGTPLITPRGHDQPSPVAAIIDTMRRQLALDSRRLHYPIVQGESTVIAKLLEQLRIHGNSPHHLLLSGPRGSGGRALAFWIVSTFKPAGSPHSPQDAPVCVDGSLMDAELFDASTGMLLARFMESSESTASLIVENIDQMPNDAQERLELLLNNYADRLRVYSTSSLPGDDLRGKLRSDLFIPLTAVEISIPPLSERREDIPLIATTLLHRRHQASETSAEQIGRETLDRLVNYPWPGNFEELDATIRSAATHCRGTTIRVEHLPLAVRTHGAPKSRESASQAAPAQLRPLEEVLADAERKHILRALDVTDGNRAAAARLLKVSRPKLLRRIEQLGI